MRSGLVLREWKLPLSSIRHRAPRTQNGRFRARLALEQLEDRAVPSHLVTPGCHLVPSGTVLPSGGSGQPAGFSPAMISQAYGFNQITFNNGTVKGDGSGQTIAIIDGYDQPNIASDLATFDSTYGLPAPPSFTKVDQNGGTNYPPADQGWGLEISLDVEWAHAMAPGANILLVESTDVFAAENYARTLPGVSVVSMSWGGSEWSSESAWDYKFTTPAGHSGITFVAATGDDGGLPEYPSASPNVLAVGGTQLSTDSLGDYLSESGWTGSSGGPSAFEPQPAYQQGVVTQGSSMRTVPDVAYNASSNSPHAVYDTSSEPGWIEVYGTSAGAPQWAALVAIADQGRALAGQSSLDGPSQTLPMLYQLPGSDFHDITSGSNAAYSAGPGYDLVTGLGTPVANLIAPALAGVASQPGPSVVTPAQATPSPVTGTTTSLSVSGTDPTGASGLTYTWSVTSAPTGAACADLQPQRHQSGAEHDGDVLPGRQLHLPGHPRRSRRTDGHQHRHRDRQPDRDQDHAHAGNCHRPRRRLPAILDHRHGPVWQCHEHAARLDLDAGQRQRRHPRRQRALHGPGLRQRDRHRPANAGPVTGSATVTTCPPGPSVVTPAKATSSPVTGTTTGLSVSGTDPTGASGLTYTWSVTSAPTGAAAPTFSLNGTNPAQNTTATFYQAGTYTFLVTLADPGGLTATSTVTVTVVQTLTTLSITPGNVTLANGAKQQFTAAARDQFGKAMASQPAFTWQVSGGGTISGTGLYTAPTSGTGNFQVNVSANGQNAQANVTVTTIPAALSKLTAKAKKGSAQVQLQWTSNSTNQSGFVVQRSSDGGVTWTTIAQLTGNPNTYTDTTARPKTTYTYRVCAYNALGDSPFSNLATVTTA